MAKLASTAQPGLFDDVTPDAGELMELVRVMRRALDVSPLVPPALRREVKARMAAMGIEPGEDDENGA